MKRVPVKSRRVVVAATMTLLIGAFLAWRQWRAPAEDASLLYRTHRLETGVVERGITASGAVKALVTVDVGSQLSGPIVEMKVDFNSAVKQGDLLAVIDRAPFEAKLAAARANLAIARAEVGRREAAAGKIQRQLGLFDRDVGRYRALASSAGVSRQQLDQAETQSGAARHDYTGANAELESARATVVLRQADVDQAEINLNRTLIRSPIDGVVIDRRMQRGQTVTAEYQTPVLFQIAQDLSQILILTQVDEADIGAVHAGDLATFSVEAFPDEIFPGVVEQIRLAATKTSGVVSYTVVVRAKNPAMRLFPEMTATVRIVTARRENVLTTPNEALRFRPPAGVGERGAGTPEQPRLWVLDARGFLQARAVRLGVRGDSGTEILGGDVRQGDVVVTRMRDALSQEAK